MKTVLTPIDFSGASEAVVATAAALSRAVHGRIVLLAVVQPPVITSEYAPMLDDLTQIVAAGEKAVARNLAQTEEQLRLDAIPVETVQRSGSPAMQIIEVAQECDADYIVMGSHGHTALYDLLVGSTTHGVVKRAHCPVVIVPPGNAERAGKAAARAGRSEHHAHSAVTAA